LSGERGVFIGFSGVRRESATAAGETTSLLTTLEDFTHEGGLGSSSVFDTGHAASGNTAGGPAFQHISADRVSRTIRDLVRTGVFNA